jgi:hypothetical protein
MAAGQFGLIGVLVLLSQLKLEIEHACMKSNALEIQLKIRHVIQVISFYLFKKLYIIIYSTYVETFCKTLPSVIIK